MENSNFEEIDKYIENFNENDSSIIEKETSNYRNIKSNLDKRNPPHGSKDLSMFNSLDIEAIENYLKASFLMEDNEKNNMDNLKKNESENKEMENNLDENNKEESMNYRQFLNSQLTFDSMVYKSNAMNEKDSPTLNQAILWKSFEASKIDDKEFFNENDNDNYLEFIEKILEGIDDNNEKTIEKIKEGKNIEEIVEKLKEVQVLDNKNFLHLRKEDKDYINKSEISNKNILDKENFNKIMPEKENFNKIIIDKENFNKISEKQNELENQKENNEEKKDFDNNNYIKIIKNNKENDYNYEKTNENENKPVLITNTNTNSNININSNINTNVNVNVNLNTKLKKNQELKSKNCIIF